ncbi:ATP-binding protein [uncultured Allobaculum sp.]|uniref:ATP-binding protein n=1 Tax=uncultured Allobaculum sp. TaxID=1187017 RepID=UPI00258D2A54|nr:ATP-binding protein [uncultured Allobaculum sp.]
MALSQSVIGQTPLPKHVHVVVVLTADDACSQAIDSAALLAQKQDALFSAVYVDTPYYRSVSEARKTKLHDAIIYAAQAGAKIEILSGTDPVYQIVEFCKSKRVSQLVITRPVRQTGLNRFRKSIAVSLMDSLPDVHIVTVPSAERTHIQTQGLVKLSTSQFFRQLAITVLVLFAATVVAFLVDSTGADEALLAPIYMLGVLICSVSSTSLFWPIFSSTAAIILFNILFASPRGSIVYYQTDLTLVFAITFVASVIAGAMGMRLHQESDQANKSSWRTQVLLENSQLLQETEQTSELIPAVCTHLAGRIHRDILFIPYDGLDFQEAAAYPSSSMYPVHLPIGQADRDAQNEAVKIKDAAGNHTPYFSDAAYLYFPWKMDGDVIGLVGINGGSDVIEGYEYMILDSIIQESAQALENRIRSEEFEQIQREAESNRLRSNILKGISHDLRTPLTSIIGNVTAAEEGKDFLTREDLSDIWRTIKADSQLLSSMVENLLTAARLDNGTMPVRPQLEVVSEIIDASLDFPKISNETHPLQVDIDDDLLLVNADHGLISQSITNMVLNAIYHTPAGTQVRLHAYEQDGWAIVDVEDQGPGIPDAEKPAIFDLFHTGSKGNVDSNHYLGLGLFLCKSIVDAHQGKLTVRDNTPEGSIFTLALPLAEMPSGDVPDLG